MDFVPMADTLDKIELLIAIEEATGIDVDRLSPAQQDELIREIGARIQKGDIPEDLDDGTLSVLVRKLGPRPSGHSGATARPEE